MKDIPNGAKIKLVLSKYLDDRALLLLVNLRMLSCSLWKSSFLVLCASFASKTNPRVLVGGQIIVQNLPFSPKTPSMNICTFTSHKRILCRPSGTLSSLHCYKG